MRKISEQAANAFMIYSSFKKSNTEVICCHSRACMYLHGNCIAEKINGKIRITNCGWFTNVTKERLNAIPMSVFIK